MGSQRVGHDWATELNWEHKVSACSVGYLGLIPGLVSSPKEGNGNPLQYVWLENPWMEGLGSLLCFDHQWQRSWSWTVLWRPIGPYRTIIKKWCHFHCKELECKSRKSRDTWSNRQVSPWSIKWSTKCHTLFFTRYSQFLSASMNLFLIIDNS